LSTLHASSVLVASGNFGVTEIGSMTFDLQ
jgi:hypothetical protein